MSILPLIVSLMLPPSAALQGVDDEVIIRRLLDANGDGHIDRYEAAAAAMAWVDEHEVAAPPVAELALGAEEEAVLAFQSVEFQWPISQADFDAAGVEFPGWQLFDVSGDRRLDLQEARTLMAVTVNSARFSVEGEAATMRGQVDSTSVGRFLQVLLEHREVNELVLEYVHVDGDQAAAVARLGDLIRQSGVALRVPRHGTVSRGAVGLLHAGSKRIIERGANLQRSHPAGAPLSSLRWLTDEEVHDQGLRTESQDLVLLPTGTQSSLRGLAAVSRDVAWATGSGATVVKTIDAGRTWSNVAPASIAGLDVRDVFAKSADRAWIMTAGPGDASRILVTEDGGAIWTELHRETSAQAFLDGLDAFDRDRFIAYGDPMEDGRFRVLLSYDGGCTWMPSKTGPLALETGEASFAASGTGLRTLDTFRAWIVTGGTNGTARVFWSDDRGESWTPAATPVAANGPGAGAFSVSFQPGGIGVIVGGDYLDREASGIGNAAYSVDFGKTWSAPEVGPRGQRAGSVALNNGWFLATGQTGTDLSRDGGRTWRAYSSEGFHCVDVSPLDGTVWFAGQNGRVARVR